MARGLGARFAAAPDDPAEVTSEKTTILLVAMACCAAGLLWALTYQLVFGWGVATMLPLAFTVVVGSSLVVSHRTRDHRYAIQAQLASIIVVTALIQWSIGGLFDSGFVMAWALLGPIGALLFFPPRRSLPWFVLYLACLVVTFAFDGQFADRALDVSPTTQRLFLAMNVGVSSVVIFVFAGYFVAQAVRERTRANDLLLNMLPRPIADRLKQDPATIADQYDSVSILFADIVGSTPLFANLEPAVVVDWLNELFSVLDEVVTRHGLEKLRTMGDNFMVGSGFPNPRPDHAIALVDCALDMVRAVEAIPARDGHRIALRFGINSGPAVAGVIGISRLHYDVWGDTVNVASRMESSGEAGRVHVSDATHALVKDAFECTPRGTIDVKGKGPMTTWFVDRRKPTLTSRLATNR